MGANIVWTDEKDNQIREGLRKRHPVDHIADTMGITAGSIRRRMVRLNLRATAVNGYRHDLRGEGARRTCLSCRKEFDSEHRGNRICGVCTEKHENGEMAAGRGMSECVINLGDVVAPHRAAA